METIKENREAVGVEVEEVDHYSIELDCPPGLPRPGDLLPGVLEGTGVEIDPEATVGRFFGNWVWNIPPDQVEKFLVARNLIKVRIELLYHQGKIRYGSW